MSVAAIILAAGKGTRMRSARAKVLHEIAGEPMIARVIRSVRALAPDPLVVVVGHQAAEVEAAVAASDATSSCRFALQEPQRGTGDSARCGLSEIAPTFNGEVLITYGDMPSISPATLRDFVESHRQSGAKLSFISIRLADPAAYGRVIRDSAGRVISIREARDASPAERAIGEINTGVYLVEASLLRSALANLKPNNAQKEYYLTDIVADAVSRGEKVAAWIAHDPAEFAGINSREELASMEKQTRETINRKLMDAGVTLIDPATAYISEQAAIAPDCVIGPNVQILGKCKIGAGVKMDGTAWLSNVTVGARSHLKLGVRAEDCTIGEDCDIGPFAHLRAGTELLGHNRIGNFVETKKARLGHGSKASHLSYLGDATIGDDTNVGCGVITVNYDGYEKHHTTIGDRCMVGCDTQLVAPVKVGDDVYVASGTTILREVPNGALAMSHHPQREKLGWVANWRRRHNDTRAVNGEHQAEIKSK
ncbi:MAG: bifunctional UDP-N-acetylglucosamine diphosphorylase/glucosamine-1-phosphate N-acetyltransferase GlmU [Candidatus Binatus sp.]|uniref:bifunctional UDP-N-acetylglucosamine diphosphorylase/glucosamine-1-phosphate N-acetyltransferase GlmU n=1 Tax=Candidatus Binatus sp. TaxID=2811406 RepID=UPI002723446C|nr:bifunctional UDP-N-acetylglucosamine diphosphorylase/glucosamine-1-phosphate N-acetyltransferase GlmU [Candidatus Binatus sp.]MDO8434640.1 bifunctional UDP-N-acetylglucosamine diphosphorylase/glucosamine-1-phosphate N-acetyltransferase GlmU [Candidatus Binatus sp.]